MTNKIINTIYQWLPDVVQLIPDFKDFDAEVGHYLLLNRIATLFTSKQKESHEDKCELQRDIIKVINLLYMSGDQYTRNAVENEFFTVLFREQSPGSLKNHLNMFPSDLKEAYLKMILNS